MPSLASNRVPLILKESKKDFSGSLIFSKSSSRVNLYKAQMACIFLDNLKKISILLVKQSNLNLFGL